MKKSLDSLPIILFFATYYFWGFFIATQAFVTSTAIILAYAYYHNPQPIKAYSSQLLIIILGGLTLATKNEAFLVWKPTVMYLLTALSLLFSQFYFKRSLLEKGLHSLNLTAPNYPWKRLDTILSVLFALMAIINLQVFRYYGLDIWVKYKFYSLFALLLLFMPVIVHIESYMTKPESIS